jgi:hypothetical protein
MPEVPFVAAIKNRFPHLEHSLSGRFAHGVGFWSAAEWGVRQLRSSSSRVPSLCPCFRFHHIAFNRTTSQGLELEGDTALMGSQTLWEGPALDPPSGVVPDLSSEGNHALGYGIIILACTLSTLSVIVRLGSRFAMKRIGIEDILMVCALVRIALGYSVAWIADHNAQGFSAGEAYLIYEVSIFPGLGVHQWNVQMQEMPRILYVGAW